MNHQTDQAENGGMTLPQCANADGQLPSSAPLANPYVPFQQTGADLYTASCALIRGTLFPGLDLPYGGQENTQEKLATASVELQQMGFALQELALYLDTHRDDREALELYRRHQQLLEKVRAEYQKRFGPLNHGTPQTSESYQWLDDPWPWEYTTNKEA